MTKSITETLLFASMAINAAFLIFIAGVFRKILNTLDVVAFKNISELLMKYSSKSAFMIIILNLPFFIAIPYYYFFGFGNQYFTASLMLWFIAGIISKIYKLPVYKMISNLDSNDELQLNEARNKMNNGNIFQAILYSIAVVIMFIGLN